MVPAPPAWSRWMCGAASPERGGGGAGGEPAAGEGPDAPRRYEVIMPIRQSVLGLIRYIEKTQEATGIDEGARCC